MRASACVPSAGALLLLAGVGAEGAVLHFMVVIFSGPVVGVLDAGALAVLVGLGLGLSATPFRSGFLAHREPP